MTVVFAAPTQNKSATVITTIPTYMISTRDIVGYEEVLGHGYGNSTYNFSKIADLFTGCPNELVIFVHGWGVDEQKAKERLDRVKMSLESNKYFNTSLVGFNWGSDTEWRAAQSLAKWNGPRLADFISNLTDGCHKLNKEVKIRVIAHSLGARVVLSSLDSLYKKSIDTNSSKNYKLASVHLLGAAVDDEEISKNPQDVYDDLTNWGTVKTDYGLAVEKVVSKFYNLFNPEDNVFEPNPKYPYSPVQIYPSFEGDLALGFKGYQTLKNITLPTNYVQINVQNEIKNIHDADGMEGEDFGLCKSTHLEFFCKVKYDGWDMGLCNFLIMSCSDPPGIGDNHGGYIGFRDLNSNKSSLKDDGAMNIVVDNWKNK